MRLMGRAEVTYMLRPQFVDTVFFYQSIPPRQ
jgi:hypothetical protein